MAQSEGRGSSFPGWGWWRDSYLDRARPCLSSCGCRSARRIPASTVTCFFSLSTCKSQHRLGRARPHLGPCFPATPLCDVGTVISACGQLEVLFSLKGDSEPEETGMLGLGNLLLKQILSYVAQTGLIFKCTIPLHPPSNWRDYRSMSQLLGNYISSSVLQYCKWNPDLGTC